MKERFTPFFHRLFSKKLAMRVRLFNVMALIGTLLSFTMAVVSSLNGDGPLTALANLLGAFFAFGLLLYAVKTGNYNRCYQLTIVGVFFVLLPLNFITSGSYQGSMPSFFIFAVAFTVFMLDGKRGIVMGCTELCVYVGLCFYEYLFPRNLYTQKSEEAIFADIVVSFVIVSVAIGAAMLMHFKLYNQQQQKLEKARQILADKNAALQQIDRLKTEFLGNVFHELKTPLTVMSGYAQTSQNQLSGKENEVVRNKMRIIASEADRLALMVGQILDITRIEEGRLGLRKLPQHMDELIYAAVETHFPMLNQNGNRLEIRCDVNLPQISVDAARITQVLVNLIANAVRHTTEGCITVSAQMREDEMVVCVADTGSGIPPEQIPTLFERFTTGNTDTGTGLGLYICKHIVEQHEGEITVQSTVGKGTTICFALPLDP